MSLASFRNVKKRQSSGRFVVSEGVAPACYLLPSEALPTFWVEDEDDRFEVLIPKGTMLSVVADSNGDSRIVPANGTGSNMTWSDTDVWNDATNATPNQAAADTTTVVVPAHSAVIGCAQYNLLRPFDKGTSQGAGWITYGYVEWPMVLGLNNTLVPGDRVCADAFGRPVKWLHSGSYPEDVVGRVVEVEKFATNFDDGMLSYMQLPSDPGALKEVYSLTKSGPYEGKLGIRVNLDVANVIGAFRVSLSL